MLHKDDARIDWSQPALVIHRRVMGLYPGAITSWKGLHLKVLATEPLVRRLAERLSPAAAALAQRWGLEPQQTGDGAATRTDPPGTVLAIEPDVGLVVASGGCPLLLREAQLEGKRASAGQSLIQQLGARLGDRLGDVA